MFYMLRPLGQMMQTLCTGYLPADVTKHHSKMSHRRKLTFVDDFRGHGREIQTQVVGMAVGAGSWAVTSSTSNRKQRVKRK